MVPLCSVPGRQPGGEPKSICLCCTLRPHVYREMTKNQKQQKNHIRVEPEDGIPHAP